MRENQKGVGQVAVFIIILIVVVVIGLVIYSNSQNQPAEVGVDTKTSDDTIKDELKTEEDKTMAAEIIESDLVHGIVLEIDGGKYYFDGPADGKNGEKDIPGHSWKFTGENTLSGKHYNSGPSGSADFWSSDAGDGVLLYDVEAIIDGWTAQKADDYAKDGFVHYHELVSADTEKLHPNKVVWLKHTAVIGFNLDGAVVGNFAHKVEPGIDFKFPPNGKTPHNPI